MNILFALAGIVIKELYRRKDFYVLFVLTALITLLLGSVSFFNDKHIIRYLKEICQTLIWGASLVIAIVTSGRQIPAEKESRTLFPLLAKPVSRTQFIFGKFLGCWLACGIALLVFYLFFAVLVGAQEQGFSILNCIKAFWLHWTCLAIVISLTLLGSLLFTSSSANATIQFIIVVGILFAGGHLNVAATNMAEPTRTIVSALYYIIPHLEWYDIRDIITHNSQAVKILPILGATLYACLYSLLLQGIAVGIFKRKSLT